MMPAMTSHCSKFFLHQFKRWRVLFFVLLAFAAQNSTYALPVMGLPVLRSNGTQAQINVSNCFPGFAQYLLQVSTNLTDWTTISTNNSTGSNFSVTVPVNGPACFYRLKTPLPFLWELGIFCKTSFYMKGNNWTLDSFDSSNPDYSTGGQYDPTKREANGNIAAYDGITNINLASADIYGTVYTGPGTPQNLVEVGPNGSVGDLAWVSEGSTGIEPGHWQSNLNLTVPDVVAPNTSGWLTALPAPTNGSIMLTNGASYVISTNFSYPLVVTTPTTIWLQGSTSLGVTISNRTWVAGGVTNTTYGQLILYVGRTIATNDSLSWSGNGTCNFPGFAANLQIYGLPSLTSIDFSGNSVWIATIYAPEAALRNGGGGANTQDSMGAIVCNSLNLSGHWNFHYDQNLALQALRY